MSDRLAVEELNRALNRKLAEIQDFDRLIAQAERDLAEKRETRSLATKDAEALRATITRLTT